MIEIYLIDGIQEVSNCTAKFTPNKLIISSTLDPEHVIFEYDLKDVLKVVENGNITYRSYVLKKFGNRIVMKWCT